MKPSIVSLAMLLLFECGSSRFVQGQTAMVDEGMDAVEVLQNVMQGNSPVLL